MLGSNIEDIFTSKLLVVHIFKTIKSFNIYSLISESEVTEELPLQEIIY